MKRAILIATLVLASISLTKPAMSTTWNKLKDTGEDLLGLYISGIYHGQDRATAMTGTPVLVCPPDGVTTAQLAAGALNYIRSKPEIWHMDVAGEAIFYWVKTFPCEE